jgi:hypothetical protein
MGQYSGHGGAQLEGQERTCRRGIVRALGGGGGEHGRNGIGSPRRVQMTEKAIT